MGIYKPNGDYLMDKPAWLDLQPDRWTGPTVSLQWVPGFPIPAWAGSELRTADISTITFEVGTYRNGAPKWRLVDDASLRSFEALVEKNRHWFW